MQSPPRICGEILYSTGFPVRSPLENSALGRGERLCKQRRKPCSFGYGAVEQFVGGFPAPFGKFRKSFPRQKCGLGVFPRIETGEEALCV